MRSRTCLLQGLPNLIQIDAQKYCLKDGWIEGKMMEGRKKGRENFSLNVFNGDIYIYYFL